MKSCITCLFQGDNNVDVNGDGKSTAKDSMTVQRYAIKLAELSEEQIKAADVDNDGKVTAKDALYILRCALNLAVLNKFHE